MRVRENNGKHIRLYATREQNVEIIRRNQREVLSPESALSLPQKVIYEKTLNSRL